MTGNYFDLNSIQNMCSILNYAVNSREKQYSLVKDLKYTIEIAWLKFEHEIIKNFVLPMEDITFNVFQQNGTTIKY